MNETSVIPLNKTAINQIFSITDIKCNNKYFVNRLSDFGFSKSTHIIRLYSSLCNGCSAYKIKGCVISIRDNDAENILVKKI